jgi:hypothetical protein
MGEIQGAVAHEPHRLVDRAEVSGVRYERRSTVGGADERAEGSKAAKDGGLG